MNQNTDIAIRYIVDSVEASIPFYSALGFEVVLHPAPGFAMLTRGTLRLLLNEPGAGGAGAGMSDGSLPAAGGWNRFQLSVDHLEELIGALKDKNMVLRSGLIKGNGGKQILLQDPSGNLVELFEPY